jgi:ABC-type glycerol-3-phosphate transport system permease component
MVFEVIIAVQLLATVLAGYKGTFKQIKRLRIIALIVFPLAMVIIPLTIVMGKIMKVTNQISAAEQEHTSIGIIVTGLPTHWLEKIIILLVIQLLMNWLLLPRLQEWKVK